jgi:hypothetical protein
LILACQNPRGGRPKPGIVVAAGEDSEAKAGIDQIN